MQYKFKCSVDLGCSCFGGECDYEDYFMVELSDKEAHDIRQKLDFKNSSDIMSDLENVLPDLHSKIFVEALSVVEYAVTRECRISGLWKDAGDFSDGYVDEDDLMEYDIKYRGFNPVNKEGKQLPYVEASRLWVEWEEEQLKDLPFDERTEFYMDRYKIPDGNIDSVNYEIEFPEELKLS